jgi:hypothetical protein
MPDGKVLLLGRLWVAALLRRLKKVISCVVGG